MSTTMETVHNTEDNHLHSDETLIILQTTNADTYIKGSEVPEEEITIADQKLIMNALLTVNKLPVELFTHIISLTKTSLEEGYHSYLPYTWVCRNWRSIIIHTPTFWTRHRHRRHALGKEPFDQELLRRSDSAKLDIMIRDDSHPYAPILQEIFAKENNRICNLELCARESAREDLSRLVLTGERFPSLRGFACRINDYNVSSLLPVLVSSDHLEMLELDLWENIDIPPNQLALVFSRILNLRLALHSDTVIPSVQALLRSSVKVQKLRIQNLDTLTLKFPISDSDQVILPELRFLSVVDPFLLNYLQAPKLTSLDVGWRFMSDAALNYKIIEEFDFSSIKYLYIRGPQVIQNDTDHDYCILGSKERIDCLSMIPLFIFEDSLCHERSRDCFHLRFKNENTFTEALREITLLVLPRSTNLIELHLSHGKAQPHPVPDFRVTLPQLQFLSVYDSSCLLENIQAPKLSSLNVNWETDNIILNRPIFEDFDFSSIKYLYIRSPRSLQESGSYCLLGSKERMHCGVFHSVMNKAPVSNGGYPCGYFHLEFKHEDTFIKRLSSEVIPLVLPQLTSLVELYFLVPHTLVDFRAIVTQTPSVEKVVVRCHSRLIYFLQLLSKPSLCPRLKHLSVTTFSPPRDPGKYAETVGKTLTSCLQSRGKGSAHKVKHIALGKCPPLPRVWLEEVRKLGAEVVTENDIIKDVIIRSSESHQQHMKEGTFSDMEV